MAAKQVDLLYIFVVQEDKSFFKFEDRFWLVKKGVEDLENVVVIPSGRYIISSDTFSDYFDKENKTKYDFNIDTSTDVRLFCEYVAPILGITVRFVGTEPLDYVTNVYNNALQETLPQYGIELKVIDRKEKDGDVISASRVRKLLQEKEFERIKKLVPKSTYEFLISRYKEKVENK